MLTRAVVRQAQYLVSSTALATDDGPYCVISSVPPGAGCVTASTPQTGRDDIGGVLGGAWPRLEPSARRSVRQRPQPTSQTTGSPQLPASAPRTGDEM